MAGLRQLLHLLRLGQKTAWGRLQGSDAPDNNTVLDSTGFMNLQKILKTQKRPRP